MEIEMKYIKQFNKEEIEIYNICCSENVDYDRIDYLLKNGADANAIEIAKYNNQEKLNEELLLVQCWLDGAFNRRIDFSNELITADCNIFIDCEKDRLSILNKYIFVDNNDIESKFERIDKDNRFEKKINKYLKNEIIEDIQFYNEEISSKPHVKNNITRIEIKISIKCDESLCFIKIIMLQKPGAFYFKNMNELEKIKLF